MSARTETADVRTLADSQRRIDADTEAALARLRATLANVSMSADKRATLRQHLVELANAQNAANMAWWATGVADGAGVEVKL
jgi:uncharacterized protein YfaS (alpha-2-macroglobulin family)